MSLTSIDACGVSELSEGERSDGDEIPELSEYSCGSGVCSSKHDGRRVMNVVLPTSIENLVTFLFTNSKCLNTFYDSRNSTGLKLSSWRWNSNDELSRIIRVNVNINQSFVGKYDSQVTQTVTIRKCSKPGKLYSVDAESHNVGVPYADSFYVLTHYCLQQLSNRTASLNAYSYVVFTKSVWIRGILEKKALAGLDDFHASLTRSLQAECNALKPAVPARKPVSPKGPPPPPPTRRKRLVKQPSFHRSASHQRAAAGSGEEAEDDAASGAGLYRYLERLTWSSTFDQDISSVHRLVFWILVTMIFIYGILLYKLASLEEWFVSNRLETRFGVDLHVFNDSPVTRDKILEIRRVMETLIDTEAVKWEEAYQTAVVLLEKVELAFQHLQNNVPLKFREKCISNFG